MASKSSRAEQALKLALENCKNKSEIVGVYLLLGELIDAGLIRLEDFLYARR